MGIEMWVITCWMYERNLYGWLTRKLRPWTRSSILPWWRREI